MLNSLMMNNLTFCATKRVLIADDFEMNRDLNTLFVQQCCQNNGDEAEITAAEDFNEARIALDSGSKFDLVITDGHLGSKYDKPEGSGFGDGLIILQKANKKIGAEKVIMMSSDDSLKTPVEENGCTFIEKGQLNTIPLIEKTLYSEKE